VGAEQFFLFGHDAAQIRELMPHYCPWQWLEGMPLLAEALALVESGAFSRGDRDLFQPLVQQLKSHDPFAVIADLDSYLQAQAAVDLAWQQVDNWRRMSILTLARSGYFSSDRAVRTYAERIWKVRPVQVSVACPLPG
jgi:starch phosphorylase